MHRMSKIRINELARELEVKPNVILELLPELGVMDKKTHSELRSDERRHRRGTAPAAWVEAAVVLSQPLLKKGRLDDAPASARTWRLRCSRRWYRSPREPSRPSRGGSFGGRSAKGSRQRRRNRRVRRILPRPPPFQLWFDMHSRRPSPPAALAQYAAAPHPRSIRFESSLHPAPPAPVSAPGIPAPAPARGSAILGRPVPAPETGSDLFQVRGRRCLRMSVRCRRRRLRCPSRDRFRFRRRARAFRAHRRQRFRVFLRHGRRCGRVRRRHRLLRLYRVEADRCVRRRNRILPDSRLRVPSCRRVRIWSRG